MARLNPNFGVLYSRIGPHLADDDQIIEIGEANWVQGSEMLGRGGGEGILVLTEKAVCFLMKDGTFTSLEISRVAEPKKTFIIIPNFTELHLNYLEDDFRWRHLSFYCTKRTARGFLEFLSSNRSRTSVKKALGERFENSLIELSNYPVIVSQRSGGFEAGSIECDGSSMTLRAEGEPNIRLDFSDQAMLARKIESIHKFNEVDIERFGVPSAGLALAFGSNITSALQIFSKMFKSHCFYVGFAEDDPVLTDVSMYLKNRDGVDLLTPFPPDLEALEITEIERHIASALKISVDSVASEVPWMITKGEVAEQDFVIKCLHQDQLWTLGHEPGEAFSSKYLPRYYDMRQIADWQLRDGGVGMSVLRLLVFDRSADVSIPLSDAIEDSAQYKLDISYVWGTRSQRIFIGKLVGEIEAKGCFDPAHRSFSPLGREFGVNLDGLWG